MPITVRDTTNNKNVMLQVDGSNQLSVKDSANGTTLTSINSALAGTLAVSDSDAKTKLSTIASALGGTLTVSEGISRSSATLTDAASVTANDYTSAVDCNSHRKIAVYGSSSINTHSIARSHPSTSSRVVVVQVLVSSTVTAAMLAIRSMQ